MNLLDTQIGLVEAEECMAIIPSFGLPACRSRKVAMSELVDPTVNLYEISSREKKMSEDARIQRFPETVYLSMGRRSRRIVPSQSCDERFYDKRSLKSLRPLLHSVKSGRAPELKGEFCPHS